MWSATSVHVPPPPSTLHPGWGQCDNMTRVDTTQHTAGIRGGVSRPLLLLANKHAQNSEVLITSICHLLILLLWRVLCYFVEFIPQCHGPRLGIDVSRIDCIDIQLLSAGVTNVIQTQAVRGITEEVV